MSGPLLLAVLTGGFAVAGPAGAQTNPFAGGWVLQPDASALNFESTKHVTKDGATVTKVETSRFATLTGDVDPEGRATVKVALDSVDTTIDLRNVRMRFLLFETFRFPEAFITARIKPQDIADLPQVKHKTLQLTYLLSLHGVTKSFRAEAEVTLAGTDLVTVSSKDPIIVRTQDFRLQPGVKKLEEAATVAIEPVARVTYRFAFARAGAASPPPAPAAPASTALEAKGDFDIEACKGRLEILSRTGNIMFRTASAALDDSSRALLDSVVDIIKRCPGLTIEVAGHTDSDGTKAANQRLSEARARSVTRYLARKGVDAARFRAVGYGETRPIVANDSAANKARNRRIEFSVVDG